MKTFMYRHFDNNDANSTTTISLQAGELGSVIINETSAHAITIQDGDETIAVLKASVVEGTYEYNIGFYTNLKIVIPASYTGDMTVTYR